jgi:hypothetical protein
MIAMRNKLIMPKIIINKINNAPVGKHNHIPDDEFDPYELEMGIGVEFKHTDDPEVAKAIAKDHLFECDSYYTRLERMERECEKDESLEKEAELTIPDDELDDEDLEDLEDEDLEDEDLEDLDD